MKNNVKLGELVDFLSGFAFKSSDYCEIGIPLVKITNINNYEQNRQFINKNLEISNKFVVNKGDILIAMSGSIGKVGRYNLNKQAYLNQRVGKIFSKDLNLLDNDYLYQFVSSNLFKQDLMMTSAGGTLANISPEQILDIEINLKPLDEQKRIAKILTCVDNNIDITEQEIKKLEQIKMGTINTLLRSASESNKLGNILIFSSGEFLPKSSMNLNGKYSVYGGNGVNGKHDQFNQELSTIIIGRVGAYCGNIHITKPKSWVTDNAIVVSLNNGHNLYYWYYLLTNMNLNQYAYSGGHPVITSATIKELDVQFHSSKEEQSSISKILMLIDQKIKKNKEKKQKLEQLKKGLLNDLL